MDRFDSAALGAGSSDECGKCGMDKNSGCCKDEVMVVKLQTSHIASPAISMDFPFLANQTVGTEFLVASFRNFSTTTHLIADSPPLSEQDTYLSNCVFRI